MFDGKFRPCLGGLCLGRRRRSRRLSFRLCPADGFDLRRARGFCLRLVLKDEFVEINLDFEYVGRGNVAQDVSGLSV